MGTCVGHFVVTQVHIWATSGPFGTTNPTVYNWFQWDYNGIHNQTTGPEPKGDIFKHTCKMYD